jgi:aminoglycoside phosphotransferase (APT) family kinase protein
MRKAPRGGNLEPYDASVEFRILGALAGSAVPVPKVYWCDAAGAVFGTSFYLMEFIEGDVPLPWNDALATDVREEMHRQFTDILAALHTVDWEAKGLAFLGVPADRTDPAALALDRCEEVLDRVKLRPHPVLREMIAYLRARRPRSPCLSLVHDDYRMGNFVWKDGRIRAILDWERVFIGDPLADIAFGRIPHLGGWCNISGDMAQRYAQRSGIVVDEARVDYWLLLETLKANLVGLAGLKPFADGRTSDLRFVEIGRYVMGNTIPAAAESIGLGR